ERVIAAYSRTTRELLEAARLCKEARDDLPRYDTKGTNALKEFKELLPFGETIFMQLVKIGSVKAFYVAANMKKLPPSRELLYELAAIPEAELTKMFKKDDIHLNMTKDDAIELRDNSSGASKVRKERAEKRAQLNDVEEDYEEDEEDTDDDEPVGKVKPKAHVDEDDDDEDDDEYDEEEDTTEYLRKMNNWYNYLEGMVSTIEPLEQAMKDEGVDKIPRKMLKEAERAAKLLTRLIQQYS
ncbi:MAG: hypothetical protein WC954_07800, partial [Sphaerochaeta sp.]